MKKYLSIIITAFCFFIFQCSTLDNIKVVTQDNDQRWDGDIDKDTGDKLQNLLDKLKEEMKTPGIQVSVRIRTRTWNGATGTTELNNKQLLDQKHLMRIASITKIFTAVVILKLIEAEKLNLDDPISKWFPGFSYSDNVTVRMLLNHTSGYYNYLSIPAVFIPSIIPYKKWDPEKLLEIASRREPYFKPGTDYKYSNTDMLILGLIAEKITNKKSKDLFHEYIFDPLDLKNTFFVPFEKENGNLISGYDKAFIGKFGIYINAPDNIAWSSSAYASGAMVSNMSDLIIFFDAIFDCKIISLESLKEMIDFMKVKIDNYPVLTGQGLGIQRFEINGDVLYGHNGVFLGFESIVLYCPDKDYTIAISCNYTRSNVIRIFSEIQKIISLK